MISGLFKTKTKDSATENETLTVGKYKIVFNSRGLIPAILQKKGRSQEKIISLAYLNRMALEMSLASGELYVYRRSRRRIQKFGEEEPNPIEIDSIRLAKNKRSLLITLKIENKNQIKKTFLYEIYSGKEKQAERDASS